MATVRKRAWKTPAGESREAWRVRYVDQAGKTRTRQFDLKRDAEAFRIKAEGEIAAGVHTADRASITVAAAAKAWIAAAELREVERGTLKAYREIVASHIVPMIGDAKLSRLSAPDVAAFRDALKQTRSTAMTRKAVRALSMILKHAQEQGRVAQNVARAVRVEFGGASRKAKVIIPPKEHIAAMLKAADRCAEHQPGLAILVKIAVLAGLRSSELRGLTWSAIDLKAGAITVAQRADRWNEIGAPKSDAGRRTVPIGPTLAADLKRWKLRCPPSDTGLVFPNSRGKILSQHRIIDLFTMVQVEAGIAIDSGRIDADGAVIWKPRYGLHSLRHVAASMWIKQGIDLKRLQTWIGHATIQLTLDTYGHLIADSARDAALATEAEAALLA